uniref:Uncharacterized protein n=1 Tax=Pipistrellus kuhlii TaxID=59472 RepID=A0A7J7SNF9_PIPKU|nr:hypothetical protein mPipKuh1_009790 [Pipistrellus kuhlii]
MISIFLNLKRLFLFLKMWSIFMNVPCALEKNVYSVALGWNVLKMSINSIWSSESYRIDISLLIFCLDDLSKGDSGVLKSPTMIILLLISLLMSSSRFFFVLFCFVFMYLGAPVLGAYIFTRVISSCWIVPFNIMKWPSFLKKIYFIDFLQRGRERDRELETSMREKHRTAASCTPPTGDVPEAQVHALDRNRTQDLSVRRPKLYH